MLFLAISNVALCICLIVNVCMNAKERRYLTGLLASRDYADYKFTEEGKRREYSTPLKKRQEKEKRVQIVEEQE